MTNPALDSRLTWLRNRLRVYENDRLTVFEHEAAEAGCPAGVYAVQRFAWRGNLPTHMALSLRSNPPTLQNDANVNEVLHVGGQYRGQIGQCEFSRTVYTQIEEI